MATVSFTLTNDLIGILTPEFARKILPAARIHLRSQGEGFFFSGLAFMFPLIVSAAYSGKFQKVTDPENKELHKFKKQLADIVWIGSLIFGTILIAYGSHQISRGITLYQIFIPELEKIANQ